MSDDEKIKEEKEKERKARAEASMREREKEVQRTLATHMRDRDKEREQHKRDEAIQVTFFLFFENTQFCMRVIFCWFSYSLAAFSKNLYSL